MRIEERLKRFPLSSPTAVSFPPADNIERHKFKTRCMETNFFLFRKYFRPRNATIKINSNMLYTSLNIPAQSPGREFVCLSLSLFSFLVLLAPKQAGIKPNFSRNQAARFAMMFGSGEASFR